MNRRSKSFVLALAVLAAIPGAAGATITFTQIDDDVFVVSHRVKLIGSRGKAMEMVYTKAASLCIAAGFTHYRVLQQESEAAQEDDAANATIQVRFFREAGEERLECARKSDPQYVRQAGEKLGRRGYESPADGAIGAVAEQAPDTGDEEICSYSCSLEQVAAMARAGLTDEQIRAACSNDG